MSEMGRSTLRKIALIVAASLAAAACTTVPVTGRQQLNLVPQADLVSVAADNYDELLRGATVVTEGDAARSLDRVGRRVAEATESFLREEGLEEELRYFDWEFALIEEDDTVNAFCMPGGRIAVYTGLIPIARDDAGLAVVVAHEVAHAVANHSGERMSQLLLAELGGRALASAIEDEPDRTRELLMLAYGVGANVGVLLPYSRAQESEADRIGLLLMASAGYDPREAVPLWERMSEAGGPRPPEFLSTHPHPSSRIEGIRQDLPEAIEIYERG
ncbi:MAG: M48 family metalloprotease [Candidatus Eisenbacteria bacterium]|nr:M48 family metalloprotease [Candidatus Eisenbacteria bacterium]